MVDAKGSDVVSPLVNGLAEILPVRQRVAHPDLHNDAVIH